MNIEEIEQKEIDFWKNSEFENPNKFSISLIAHKMAEARIFLLKIKEYKDLFEKAETILEIGGGQGWASCILKNLYPDKAIISSDISEHAIEGTKHWEELFKVKLDKKITCPSHKIPLKDESIDLIFCFQTAHHLRRKNETLNEISKKLKQNGHCLFIQEPTCNKLLYKPALFRVNRKRPQVPEDIIIKKNLLSLAKKNNFKKTKAINTPLLLNRGPVETLYFYILNKLPFLQKILPTTTDFIFQK